jgi:large subunit ribosomal protein L6
MSRKGRSPIGLPKGVEIKVADNTVTVKGPKGSLEQVMKPGVVVKIEDAEISVSVEEKLSEELPGAHGLYWSLINNMITGASTGWTKTLDLIGVGYRAAVKGSQLDLQLGFSHPSLVDIPQGIKVQVEKNTKVIITGADKRVVGSFAADVRALRPPEPYKGKGIRYTDEYVRRKAGKSGKK